MRNVPPGIQTMSSVNASSRRLRSTSACNTITSLHLLHLYCVQQSPSARSAAGVERRFSAGERTAFELRNICQLSHSCCHCGPHRCATRYVSVSSLVRAEVVWLTLHHDAFNAMVLRVTATAC